MAPCKYQICINTPFIFFLDDKIMDLSILKYLAHNKPNVASMIGFGYEMAGKSAGKGENHDLVTITY